jgi:hypothetical protein
MVIFQKIPWAVTAAGVSGWRIRDGPQTETKANSPIPRHLPPLPGSTPNEVRTKGGDPLTGGYTQGSWHDRVEVRIPLPLLCLLPWVHLAPNNGLAVRDVAANAVPLPKPPLEGGAKKTSTPSVGCWQPDTGGDLSR